MSEITSITPQQKDKTRCNIEIDGKFYCGMKLDTVLANGLKAGMSVDTEFLSQLQLESEKLTALDKALKHISVSMKTEKEIRAFLKKKGYLEDVSNYVLEKMKDYGYVDDETYAASYTAGASKRKGSRLIQLELRQKGVDEQIIDSALSSLTDETESAKRCLEKYMRGKPFDEKTLQKAYRNLLSKGFDYDTCKQAIESLKNED